MAESLHRREPQRLLVLELWGLGDLALATEFLRAASRSFRVSLLAKAYAEDLRPFLWPKVTVIPFHAPWTAFRGKYQLWRWPLAGLVRSIRHLRRNAFTVGVSARPDPRDHALLWLAAARQRAGFPHPTSRPFLNRQVRPSAPRLHRYQAWRELGTSLGLEIPSLPDLPRYPATRDRIVCVHSGAAQPVRVWPLERMAEVVRYCRQHGWKVLLLCDPNQLDWWRSHGEPQAEAPASVAALARTLSRCGFFIGNDSGPGHLAAALGIPTFTIFGPQLPELFAPAHPDRVWIEGKPCPYKPCWDYCRFSQPRCLTDVSAAEVHSLLERFLRFT